MINPEDYMLYGFLAFISLLQVIIIAMLFRQSRDIRRLEGQLRCIHDQLIILNQKIDAINRSLTVVIERLAEQIVDLREQVCQLARTGCRNQRNANLPERARGPALAPIAITMPAG